MIWITGDTHRNFSRFSPDRFPEMRTITKADTVIICGDCGVLWHGGRRDEIQLAILKDLPFTIAFVDGILDPAAEDYHERLLRLLMEGRRQYRIQGQSWWPEELPSEEAYAEARRNLDACGWTVDCIITHSPPSGLAGSLGRPQDELTDFLEEIRQKASYRRWMFGHCHGDQAMDEKHLLLWEQIVRVI